MSDRNVFWLAALVMFAPHCDKLGGIAIGATLFFVSLFLKENP